jgi:hypothetical protein
MNRNTCASVRELLALRPADWNEDERRRAEEHLSACAECAGLSRAYAAQDQALQALPTAGLDEPARQQFFARLEREKGRAGGRQQPSWVLGAVLGAIALVVISLAISFLIVQGDWTQSTQKNPPTTGPTQATMPSPTITPTTSLTPTPVGDRIWPLTTRTYAFRSPVARGQELAGVADSSAALPPAAPPVQGVESPRPATFFSAFSGASVTPTGPRASCGNRCAVELGSYCAIFSRLASCAPTQGVVQ